MKLTFKKYFQYNILKTFYKYYIVKKKMFLNYFQNVKYNVSMIDDV